MTTPVELSKKELNKVFWRSYQALGCYTYDKRREFPTCARCFRRCRNYIRIRKI